MQNNTESVRAAAFWRRAIEPGAGSPEADHGGAGPKPLGWCGSPCVYPWTLTKSSAEYLDCRLCSPPPDWRDAAHAEGARQGGVYRRSLFWPCYRHGGRVVPIFWLLDRDAAFNGRWRRLLRLAHNLEIEMRKHIASVYLASVLSLALYSSAIANPVTAKDLSGKKICWSNGNVSTFSPGGKYSSPIVGEGTWSVTSIGIQLKTTQFTGILDIDRQPDGTFKSTLEKSVGNYCK